jgi:hypothetical protein
VTQGKPLEELEKVREKLSEMVTQLKNNEITFEEANAKIRELKEALINIARELKNIERKIRNNHKRATLRDRSGLISINSAPKPFPLLFPLLVKKWNRGHSDSGWELSWELIF